MEESREYDHEEKDVRVGFSSYSYLSHSILLHLLRLSFSDSATVGRTQRSDGANHEKRQYSSALLRAWCTEKLKQGISFDAEGEAHGLLAHLTRRKEILVP